MYRKHQILIILLASVLWLGSCGPGEEVPEFPVKSVEGYKPYYENTNAKAKDSIILSDPKTLTNPGKIYVYNDYLFINERGEGVHVVNNTAPANPSKVGFINVPGNEDIAIKNGTMYADSFNQMMVIDISNPDSVKLVNTLTFGDDVDTSVPPEKDVYFECIEPGREDEIRGWVKTRLENPECYY